MPATTGGLNTVRDNLFYVGAGKEAAWGTSVVPTWWWRWLDGTDANPDAKFAEERVGDTSPHISLVYRTAQWEMIKIVEYLWPQTAGYAMQALLGTGSDAYTAPTSSTTLSSTVVAGASSFSVAASLGNSGTGWFNFTPGYASATYETRNVNLVSRSGTGPYTYSLVAGQTFANAHNNADAVTSPSVHAFTRQSSTFDAYSIEYAFGSSAFGIAKAFRIQDCVCTDLTLTSETGKLVKLEHTWYGAPAAIQAALSSPTYEGTGVVGSAGGPLGHFAAQTSWQLDGAGTGNAVTIKKLSLKLKNSTKPEELQSELIYAPYYMPGNFDIDADVQVIFQSYNQYLETYYGSSSATTGATDATLVGYGSLSATWAAANLPGTNDGVNSLALSLPNVAYKAAKVTPKLDGKPVEQPITLKAVRSLGQATPLTLTLTNSYASQY